MSNNKGPIVVLEGEDGKIVKDWIGKGKIPRPEEMVKEHRDLVAEHDGDGYGGKSPVANPTLEDIIWGFWY